MEGHCSTGQSPQWAVVPMEEEEDTLRYSQSAPTSKLTENFMVLLSDCKGEHLAITHHEGTKRE